MAVFILSEPQMRELSLIRQMRRKRHHRRQILPFVTHILEQGLMADPEKLCAGERNVQDVHKYVDTPK